MKVPSIDPTRGVQQTATKPVYGNADLNDRGSAQLAQGLRSAGSSLDNVLKGLMEEADTVAVTDRLNELKQDEITSMQGGGQLKSVTKQGDSASQISLDSTFSEPTEGFLSLKGREAIEHSADTIEFLEKRREELAADLNPRQQKKFHEKSQQLLLHSLEKVESHASSQREWAKKQTLTATTALNLRDITSDYANEELVAEKASDVEQLIRTLVPAEGRELAVAEWKENVATARLNQYLAAGDEVGARNLFSRSRKELGVHAPQFEKVIEKVEEKKFEEVTAKKIAAETINPETGQMDRASAFAKVDELPEKKREGVRRLTEDRVRAAEGAWKQQVETVFNRALTPMLKEHSITAIAPADEAWLREKAPEEWDKLEKKDWEWREFWRRRERGDRADRAVSTPDQRQNFIRFQAELQAHPDKYKAMSDGELASIWLSRLSDDDYERAGTMWAATKKEPKDAGGDFTKAVDDYVKAAPEFEGKSKKQQADMFRAKIGEARRSFKAQNNGKEPTPADFETLKDNAWKATTREYFFGVFKKQTPAWKEEAPLPIPQRPRSTFQPGSTLEEGAGTVLRAPPPTAKAAPSTKPSGKKEPVARAAELKAQGKNRREAFEIMKREGY